MLSALLAMVVSSQGVAPDALAKDFVVLRRAYTELHPGLYRYNTKEQMEANFEQLRLAWTRSKSLSDAYLSLSEFLAKVQCGHSYANFFNQDDTIQKVLFEQKDKVPFTFTWIKDSMVVTRDCSVEKAFPRGTVITSIDGVRTSDILKRLLIYARADGNNKAKRIDYLGVTGSKYEAFDIFHPLVFPMKGDKFKFDAFLPGYRGMSSIEANAVTMESRIQEQTKKVEWELKTLQPGVAYLPMPSWVMYNSKWNWKGFLKTTFESLVADKVPNLIIDLRGNEGGDAVGDEIMRYLVKEPVNQAASGRYVRFQSVPADLRPFLDTWDKSFFELGKAATLGENNLFALTKPEDQRTTIRPAEKTYTGKVFVLVGPANSSATFLFASNVKRHKLGTLVGQSTGGNQQGITGGAFFFLRLPNTKLEVDLPLIAQVFPDKQPDAGIEPDVLVEPTVQDVVDGRDRTLEVTLQLAPRDSVFKVPEIGTNR